MRNRVQRPGDLLTIQATASGWTGGTTSLDVPWPPAAGTTVLRRALAAMGQVPAMTVYEQVTSDTALGVGTTHAIGISGRQFLAGEPYTGGIVPAADLVRGGGGQRVLLLGFPGAGIWAELTLGAHGAPDRFAHEILVDPDHLTIKVHVWLPGTVSQSRELGDRCPGLLERFPALAVGDEQGRLQPRDHHAAYAGAQDQLEYPRDRSRPWASTITAPTE